jgi:DNA polymerase III subunit delta'
MIIGHQKQWNFLRKSAEKENLSHAYLFYGPSKTGKKTIALELAKIINNYQGDISFLTEAPETEAILISQTRELKEKLSLSAAGGGYKIAIIDVVSKITFDAQGALLKLLEEPKGRTVIILIAGHISQFLPTIVSRCQLIRFGLVEREKIERELLKGKISASKAEEIAFLSFGKPGVAVDCLHNPQIAETEKEKIKNIQKLQDASLYEKFKDVEKLAKNPEILNSTTETWLNYFRSLLLEKLGRRHLPEELENNSYSLAKIRNIIEFLEKIRLLLNTTNVNPRLSLEIFFMKI